MRGLLQVAAERLADWEARAEEPEIQDLIRGAIRRGGIRVRPTPEGRIRIIPIREARAAMEHETGMGGLGGPSDRGL